MVARRNSVNETSRMRKLKQRKRNVGKAKHRKSKHIFYILLFQFSPPRNYLCYSPLTFDLCSNFYFRRKRTDKHKHNCRNN